MTYQPKVYKEPGGDKLVVASGGEIEVQSGGTVDIQDGATFSIGDALEAPGDIALAVGSVIVGAGSPAKGTALDAKGDGKIIVGNGTTVTSVNVSGDATLANTGAVAVTGLNSSATAVTGATVTALAAVPADHIVVAKNGNDTTGKGSFALPYLTIAKAVSVWTGTRSTIYVLAGEYSEVALVWPNVSGLSLVGIGEVSITNSDAAAAVLTIAPTYTASSFGATIKGSVNLAGTGAQIGMAVANANMTKKLNVYIDGLSAEIGTSGDSIDIAGTVSGQAIRVYAKNLNLEGLLHFTANDAGSRLRVGNSDLMGGLTCAGAVAAESALDDVTMLYGGKSIATEWNENNWACVYATDAVPRVYSQFADVWAG